MLGIGMQELIVIFIVALLIFGPKKLPELARALGKAIAEFKKVSNEISRSIQLEAEKEEEKPSSELKTSPSPQDAYPSTPSATSKEIDKDAR